MREEDKEVFDNYKAYKVIKPNVIFDWDVMQKFGLVRKFERILADRAWYNLFMMEEDLYEETIITFVSTFKISGTITDGLRNEVEFLARGEYHKLSMLEFISAMGIYDEGFLQTPEFRTLPVS